jgi:homoserine kinase type II
LISSSSAADLENALRCYPLGELRAAQRIERGFVNENWIVTTERGRYFLKRRHPDLRQYEVIRAQHDLMRRLRQLGFPAPAIVSTTQDETLLILDGEFYEIQEIIEGEPHDDERLEHLEEAALTLGRYCVCVQGLAPQALRQPGKLYAPTLARTALIHLIQAWQLDQDPELSPILRQLQAHVADLAVRFARHGSLPHLIIHGDYYAGNLIFQGDHIVGVVDYDKARWQPRVVELAEALIYFASPRPGPLQYLVYPGALDLGRFKHFLQSYARVVILAENELYALPDYIRCIWLQVSLTRLLERGSRPSWSCQALHEALMLADWAAAHTHAIVEIGRSTVLQHPRMSDSPAGSTMIQLRPEGP